MKNNHDQILKVLSYDSLHEAERLTGKSYKEDAATVGLGMALAVSGNRRKKELLEFARDTYWGITPGAALKRLVEEGFVIHASDEFSGTADHHAGQIDRWYILYDKRRGLLVWMETYGSKVEPQSAINSIALYFNWKRANKEIDFPPHCSWAYYGPQGEDAMDPNIPSDQLVLVGSYDGREGLFNLIDWLEANGTFVTPWAKSPFLWFLTYADPEVKGYDHEAITAARLALLPAGIRSKLARGQV